MNWKECSDCCKEKPGCKYWTWYPSKSLCLTMTNARRVRSKKNVWSGTRECGGVWTFPGHRCHYAENDSGNLLCEGGCVDWKTGKKRAWGLHLHIDHCNTCVCSKGERKYCNSHLMEARDEVGEDGLLDCSQYACEDKRGRAVKEGKMFTPEGDCNPRICKNRKPSGDCWTWGPGTNHNGTVCIDLSWTSLTLCHERTTCIDCDKKYPGCMDKDGNMYKHGERFVPKGNCNTCSCNQGKVGGCTLMRCFK